jgi:hypothetical protein
MQKEVTLPNLELDLSNYRTGQKISQVDAMHALIKEQGNKLAVLAEDILVYGLSPIETLAAMPKDGTADRFIVIEGNRRVTAMKLVANPELAEGTSLYAIFKKLHAKKNDLPKTLPFHIFKNKQQAAIWIRRRHDSGLKGAGLDPWSAMAKKRAEAEQGKSSPSHSVLEFVLNHGDLEESVKESIVDNSFSVTNLDRLIKSKSVRNALGIAEKKGNLSSSFDKKWTAKVLGKVVSIISAGNFDGNPFSVSAIYTAKKQEEFIEKVVNLIGQPKKAPQNWQIDAATELDNGTYYGAIAKKLSSKKLNPHTAQRATLVPKSTIVKPPVGRANNILHEMQGLKVAKTENACAVLLRVFVEFSVDAYIKKHNVSHNNDQLNVKTKAVCDDMVLQEVATKKELTSIFKMVSDHNSLFSTYQLNAYIHNPKLFPSAAELKTSWDNLEDFLSKTWSY